MRLEKFERERLLRILDFLTSEIDDLNKKFLSIDFKTYSQDSDKRRSLERCIENIVNSGLDIAKIVLVNGGARIPDTYKGYFMNLYSTGLVSKNIASGLADGVRLRNVLAHQYLDIKWHSLKTFLQKGWKYYKKLVEILNKIFEEEES